MGNDPTIFVRPASPRVSIALLVTLAVSFLAGSVVGSLSAAAAAAAGALLTWRFGPLIGGIATGALSAAVVMADPILVHPMPTNLLVWVIGLMVAAMATGMVARRDSARAALDPVTPPERPIPSRTRETPVRSARVTGEHPRLRSNPEIAALVLPPAPPRASTTAESAVPMAALPASELAVQELERDVVRRFLRDVRDALGADEVALWQHFEDTDEVQCYAAAVQAPESLQLTTKPPLDSLVHTAAVGGVGVNYDSELNYFYAIPAGAEGRFHGALGVYAEDRQSFNRDRAKVALRDSVDRLAELLHLLYDGRETRRYRGKVEEVANAVENIQRQREMGPLHAEICRAALDVTGASRAAFVTWDPETKTGRVDKMQPPGITAPVVAPTALAGLACAGKGIALRENFTHAGIALFAASESFTKPASAAAVGLMKDGHAVGAIVVVGDRPGQLSAVEVNLLRPVARFAYTAWVSVNQLEQAKGQAVKDALTGLANRRAFDERMSQMMASSDRFGHKTSLILVDVDKFKNINDTYGHAAGDEVLKVLAATLMKGVRDVDFVARYGGEEVAIILPQTEGKWARAAAERLRVAVEKMQVVAEGKQIPVTASFGVACHPESVFGQENLFKAADEALYAAKHAGRNRVMFAEPKPAPPKS